MSEVIYRAAEAIRKEMRSLNVQWFVDDAASPDEGSREMTPYNLLAVAAIAAMREPTEAMLDAGGRKPGTSGYFARECWVAMIDAALAEGAK